MTVKIIIGLGNPGNTYANNRHNVGFLAIEALRQEIGGSEWRDSKFSGVTSEVKACGDTVILLRPTTYMNLSGKAVAAICHYYKVDPIHDILVLSDDLDMEFGKVRYRSSGSHGGQNGLKDIIHSLGTDTFSRIKIGIGRHEKMSVSDWVLSDFKKEELGELEETVFPIVINRIHTWLKETT